MKRPTIADLAAAAGVSVSTVDRVLSGRNPVRRATADQVLAAAERIGFYATGAIRNRLGADKPERTFGFLMQQGNRTLYRDLGAALAEATKASTKIRGTPRVEHLDDLSPEIVAERMLRLGSKVDALGVVAAEHPRVTEAIEQLAAKGIPTFALISALTAGSGVGYVGLDNWKLGRTAGWAMAGFCKRPGKVGIVVGSHRYRCQELNEIGFRSYFREHAPEFEILEPLTSLEDRRFAAELTRDLLKRAPDLAGLYVAGGGISGVMQVLRETADRRGIVAIGHDLTAQTRSGLLDGVLTLVLSHPMKALASAAADAMAEATTEGRHRPLAQITLPFEFCTAENV